MNEMPYFPVLHLKASNLERHLTSHHANMTQQFPKSEELHKHKENR